MVCSTCSPLSSSSQRAWSTIFMFLACVIYPNGWGSSEVLEICGTTASEYRLGECSIRWAYILAMLGIFDAAALALLAFFSLLSYLPVRLVILSVCTGLFGTSVVRFVRLCLMFLSFYLYFSHCSDVSSVHGLDCSVYSGVERLPGEQAAPAHPAVGVGCTRRRDGSLQRVLSPFPQATLNQGLPAVTSSQQPCGTGNGHSLTTHYASVLLLLFILPTKETN
ncbi:hypothetical protein C0Q70_15310 [Pomacea canaliculata]|uniref:Uncharacterized protein n=1 Tax=Pomacea canaliculata TaxID=400727 RepID=A0A2T7NUJ6_POMCA|nr:hypothetical protein C0Q70_15310 [Pomacea canaliculata]